MVHTADIARGHSGGPLVDACGRVVGVNVALTNNESGDASFGFAIPAASLQAFLREAGQTMSANASPCISSEERERAEAERVQRSERERDADEAARLRAADERQARAMATIAETRETRLYIALLLLVLCLAAMGAAGILVLKNSTVRRSRWRGGGGPADRLGMGVHDAARAERRPSRRERGSRQRKPRDRFVGRNSCRLDRERSRVTVSNEAVVELSWDAQGCVNETTQYAQDGAVWRRVLVPNQEQTVTVSEFDPASGQYVVSRYLLSAQAMTEARRLRRAVEQKACTTDQEARRRMAGQQRDLVEALPQRPNERLVYACEPAGG
jgi:hypothetical protein